MTEQKIKQWIKDAHDNAIEKGFYDCPECGGGGAIAYKGNTDILGVACGNCNSTGIDPNKNIGELLMLIVSELGKALEAHRCGRFACGIESIRDLPDNKLQFTKFFCNNIKDTFEDEIADVFIRLFDLCRYLGIDPEINVGDSELAYQTNVGESLCIITEFVCYIRTGTKLERTEYISVALSSLKDLCDYLIIPIEKHISAKMAYNKTRPRKHGKQY